MRHYKDKHPESEPPDHIIAAGEAALREQAAQQAAEYSGLPGITGIKDEDEQQLIIDVRFYINYGLLMTVILNL